ncbi:ribosome maturation protein [Lipomyces chichibuensis]|uniref:ribosome maturation protein n=1 Tax=Lipomyces chichibuensis TaxID=1546026 RepID=UPI00334418F4
MSNNEVPKVFYRGKNEEFMVVIQSPEDYRRYKKDTSIPLIDVVDSFKVFVTQAGKRGIIDEASRAMLEKEFGTKNSDQAIQKILKDGEFQEQKYTYKTEYDSTNDSMGARVAH